MYCADARFARAPMRPNKFGPTVWALPDGVRGGTCSSLWGGIYCADGRFARAPMRPNKFGPTVWAPARAVVLLPLPGDQIGFSLQAQGDIGRVGVNKNVDLVCAGRAGWPVFTGRSC